MSQNPNPPALLFPPQHNTYYLPIPCLTFLRLAICCLSSLNKSYLQEAGLLLGLLTNASQVLTVGSGPWRPAMIFEQIRSLYEGWKKESLIFQGGHVGFVWELHRDEMIRLQKKQPPSQKHQCPEGPSSSIWGRITLPKRGLPAALASALKAHPIHHLIHPKSVWKGSFSRGGLEGWESIWIWMCHFLWTTFYWTANLLWSRFFPSFPPFPSPFKKSLNHFVLKTELLISKNELLMLFVTVFQQ